MPKMNIRATIALFMGLLLQWSMVQAFPDTIPAKSCGSESASMACCASKQVCPCLDQSESSEKPAPLAPTSSVLKLIFAAVPATDDSVETTAIPPAVQVSPHTKASSTAGYPGVPLSVAFCSFVI